MFEYFLDNYVWNLGVLICLNSGGSISEVDEACRPLKEWAQKGDSPKAHEAWHENWKRIGERVERLAVRDEEAGNLLGAGRKYMRASLYYVAAERMMTNPCQII